MFPVRYLPRQITVHDRVIQKRELQTSRKAYLKHKYHTRKHISSFQSRPSSHIATAKRIYGVDSIDATDDLAKTSGCSKRALRAIIRKGEGAYYSSGSRPNQTSQNWGKARLGSALTSGKASVVDYPILKRGCRPNSRALNMAKRALRKFGKTLRKTPKTQ